MNKSIDILNIGTGNFDSHFYSDLEKELGNGNKCFNCAFCGDITNETSLVSQSVVECLGAQAGVDNIKIGERCYGHELVKDYSILRKGD